MGILDLVLLGILILAAVRGFKRGLVMEVLGIASIFIAAYAAYWLTAPISDWVKSDFSYKEELIFVVVAIAFMFGTVTVAKFISKLFDTIGLGIADKIGGGIISVLKYTIILSVVLTLLIPLNDKFGFVEKNTLKETQLFKPMSKISSYMFPYFKDAKKGVESIQDKFFD